MALSGLDIYKLLAKTNCRECGYATCLAFAMQLAKKAVSIDKCPYISQEAKKALEASSLPPVRLITIGKDDHKLEVGNETVLFRHEEKFYHPAGIGFIIDDNLNDSQIKARLSAIKELNFERVGQALDVNLIALRQKSTKEKFLAALKLILANSNLALVLMNKDADTMAAAVELSGQGRPLLYPLLKELLSEAGELSLKHKIPLVVTGDNLDELSALAKELSNKGVVDIVLAPRSKSLPQQIWDLTSIRRLALKKNERSLGYPILVAIENSASYEETILAAVGVLKYASIVLLEGVEKWQALSLLTLRQNIYTDPQKPLQIEPKLYPVGQATDKSPVLITTNFSLTYYTVLGEVEASKIPSYILSVDTEGMSVLTAWAAEKFTPEKISDSIDKFGLKEAVSHKRLIIPGYVAVISGDLEDKTGCEIIVGPKEASGIPSFLKNL